jgi:hypothetical protein
VLAFGGDAAELSFCWAKATGAASIKVATAAEARKAFMGSPCDWIKDRYPPARVVAISP